MNTLKRMATALVALALLLGWFPAPQSVGGAVLIPSALAAGSPIKAPTTKPAQAPAPKPVSGFAKTAKAEYTTSANGTAVFRATQLKKSNEITVPKTVTTGGVTYQVTTIGPKAFQGSKAKSIKLCGNVKSIIKDALKGSKVPVGRITVKINESAFTKKQRISLKKQLIKAGIKAKNIRYY